jgi:exodeoxyribonuclease-3
LKNWRSNQKNSGFLPEERAWMTHLLARAAGRWRRRRWAWWTSTASCSPIPPTTAYTWWSNRGQAYANNVGWRLDYHLATPKTAALARSEHILQGP